MTITRCHSLWIRKDAYTKGAMESEVVVQSNDSCHGNIITHLTHAGTLGDTFILVSIVTEIIGASLFCSPLYYCKAVVTGEGRATWQHGDSLFAYNITLANNTHYLYLHHVM